MNNHEPDLIGTLHHEAVRRHVEEQQRCQKLVDVYHRRALEEHEERRRRGNDRVDAVGQTPALAADARTIHHTDIPEADADSPLRQEWNVYHREVRRLLAEGHAGRHVLIKGDDILGLWDTEAEALRQGYQRFLGQPFLVHQVQERERVLRCVSVQAVYLTLAAG